MSRRCVIGRYINLRRLGCSKGTEVRFHQLAVHTRWRNKNEDGQILGCKMYITEYRNCSCVDCQTKVCSRFPMSPFDSSVGASPTLVNRREISQSDIRSPHLLHPARVRAKFAVRHQHRMCIAAESCQRSASRPEAYPKESKPNAASRPMRLQRPEANPGDSISSILTAASLSSKDLKTSKHGRR